MVGKPNKRWPAPVLAALVLSAALVLGTSSRDAQAGPAAGSPPNVIVVMTDDQGPRMMRALPSVERLIGEAGTTFENAFATYPLCCPSRATLLTGQLAHNHGTLGNGPRSGGGYSALSARKRNLAAWLAAGGYATHFVGKWLNGLRTPRQAPPGWTNWHGLVGAGGEGLSSFYDYDVFEADGKPRHFGTRASDYQTDALTREYALPLIEAEALTAEPFFLWLAYHPPHDGLGRDDPAGRRCSIGEPDVRGGVQSAIPAPRHAKRFTRAPIPHPPSFNERDMSDKPRFLRRRDPLGRQDLARLRLNYRCGLAALLAVDEAVRAIVAELDSTRQLANTVIVFTADQGAFFGEHRIKAGKNRPYEEAISVPLLIRGPGISAQRIAAPVANADVTATILEQTGVTVPAELARPLDGASLLETLAGAGDEPRRVIPIEGRNEVERARSGFKVRSYVGVRTARFAYFEHRRASAGTAAEGAAMEIGRGRTTDRELYDLQRDPFQLENVVRRRAYTETRRELAALTGLLERCAGAECVVSDRIPPPTD